MDCENCRHLTVVGLHDTGPWATDRNRQTKLLKTWKAIHLNFLLQKSDKCSRVVGGWRLFNVLPTGKVYLEKGPAESLLRAVTLRQVAEQTFCPAHFLYIDIEPTSPSADLAAPGF